MGERDRINHVHYRNVVVHTYGGLRGNVSDDGETDMFAVMKELVNQKYNLGIYPEHRLLDYDRGNPYTTSQYRWRWLFGYAYNVAYARAMLQAADDRLQPF